jgi:SET domain-containing protein
MALLQKQLYVKKSTLPAAGRGLFTRGFISKGALIVEYKGQVLTWKEVEKMPDYRNGYVFYVNSKHVIDAWNYKKALGRYANDAKGITRRNGNITNSEYFVHKKRCYIKATQDIPANDEIFVEYGAEYWQVIRYNARVEQKNKDRVNGKKVELSRKLARRQRTN